MQGDIVALLWEIQEKVRAVENGNTDASVLDGVKVDFLELMELVKLFLISERDSYYGYFLMNMAFRVNFRSRSVAGIRLGEFPPVLESNPLLLCRFTLKEILYVVCHEIDHIMLNHPAEMLRANPTNAPDVFERFNLAADASVNDRLNHEIREAKRNFLSMPEGCVTSASLKKMFRLKQADPMESYAYYYALIKDSPDEKATNGQTEMLSRLPDNQHGKQGGSAPASGDGEPGGQGTSTAQDGSEATDGKGGIVTAGNCGKAEDHQWGAGDDPEDAQAAAREIVNAAVSMMNEEIRGLMPAGFMSQVQRINAPPVISWQALLKKYVGTISAEKRRTRTRLNRRQPDRFDLSGAIDEKILKIVVAVDTSGSMDDAQIQAVFREIFAILAKRKYEVTIIECDAKVQRVYKVSKPANIALSIKGRGGTAFTPVVEYINNDRYFRDALLIYFTDGYGENAIPRPRTYRNLWVILGNTAHLSLREPYGTKVAMQQAQRR